MHLSICYIKWHILGINDISPPWFGPGALLPASRSAGGSVHVYGLPRICLCFCKWGWRSCKEFHLCTWAANSTFLNVLYAVQHKTKSQTEDAGCLHTHRRLLVPGSVGYNLSVSSHHVTCFVMIPRGIDINFIYIESVCRAEIEERATWRHRG